MEFTGIPDHILNSELSNIGKITHVLETNTDSICIAHIEPHSDPEDCICVVYRDTMDGIAPITSDCPQCTTLIDAIIVLASHLVHGN